MARRVAVKPKEKPEPQDGPAFDDEIEFDEPASEREPEASPYAKRDDSELDDIVAGIVSRSPRKLHASLTKSERVGSRERRVLEKALDDELGHVREAASMVMIATRKLGRLRLEEAKLKAELKAEAEDKAPRKLNKDGTPKALTVDAIQDYYRSHPKMFAIREKLADYEGFEQYCQTMARARVYRSRAIEKLIDSAKPMGAPSTGYEES